MTSTFHGLETVRRNLFAQRSVMDTIGHNIANSNTEGYSRQRVNLVASRPMETPALMSSTTVGQMGTGVEAQSIARVREKFLDDQYRNENQAFGRFGIEQDVLSKVEKVFNEPSDQGISSLITKFYNAWSDLSQTPESIDARKLVTEQSTALAESLNTVSRQLSDLKDDITSNISSAIYEANSYLEDIARLNEDIRRVEVYGDNANDLRDQRDLYTDKLSKIIKVKVDYASTGYNISIGSRTLVDNGTATALTEQDVADDFADNVLTGGQLYGMYQSRDSYIQTFTDQLDKLADTMANGEIQITIPAGAMLPEGTVLDGVTYSGASRTLSSDLTVTVKGLNQLHQLGYNLGSTTPTALFVNADGNTGPLTAANIRLNPDIANDSSLIATSMRFKTSGGVESVVAGNNSLAILMSQTRDARYDFGTDTQENKQTAVIYFRSILTELGLKSREATRKLSSQDAVISQIDVTRQSVSSVSLDEEMADMIKFQQAYNAAARNMTMIDEMLDRVINGMGKVGM